MKQVLSILCLGVIVATSAQAWDNTTNYFDAEAWQAIKDAGVTQTPPNGTPDTGGENIGTATVIPALPYTDSDNTCGHVNDYTPSCTSSNAPDLVYSYTPAANQTLDISLCNLQGYDTVLYVYQDGPGTEIACNDDACGLQSRLPSVNVSVGHTYYIVIDGYSTACGNYRLDVRALAPCNYVCPPDAQLEGEPVCGTDYVDNYNGGCNSTPNVFQDMRCDYLCGETGTYTFQGLSYRDTDWFTVNVQVGSQYTFDGMGEGFALQRLVIAPGCPANVLYSTTVNCDPITFTATTSQVVLWAGPTVFSGLPCGSRYWISISGPGIPPCGATATENTTWGSVKAIYR